MPLFNRERYTSGPVKFYPGTSLPTEVYLTRKFGTEADQNSGYLVVRPGNQICNPDIVCRFITSSQIMPGDDQVVEIAGARVRKGDYRLRVWEDSNGNMKDYDLQIHPEMRIPTDELVEAMDNIPPEAQQIISSQMAAFVPICTVAADGQMLFGLPAGVLFSMTKENGIEVSPAITGRYPVETHGEWVKDEVPYRLLLSKPPYSFEVVVCQIDLSDIQPGILTLLSGWTPRGANRFLSLDLIIGLQFGYRKSDEINTRIVHLIQQGNFHNKDISSTVNPFVQLKLYTKS